MTTSDKKLNKLVEETYSKLREIKEIDTYLKSKENGEINIVWEIFANPKTSKSELEIFKEKKDVINKADKIIYELAKYCDKNAISYSFKLCKSNKLERTIDRIPVLLTSYIAFNFPVNEYYLTKEHDDIQDADEEFELRNSI